MLDGWQEAFLPIFYFYFLSSSELILEIFISDFQL